MVSGKLWELFRDYLIFYPEEDESGFDGVHYGGIKGIKDDAPQSAKEAFAQYQEEKKRATDRGLKT